MISSVLQMECDLPPISKTEVLRYAGAMKPSAELQALLCECVDESEGIFTNKVVYRILPIERRENALLIGSMKIESAELRKNLTDCEKVILFAATAGLAIDRLISKYSKLSPGRALMLHSIGAERIEALCDAFCQKISSQERIDLAPRFSPGYGDLPLELQREILTLLNGTQILGIGLNESLLLSPTKSVTAFAGIKAKERT